MKHCCKEMGFFLKEGKIGISYDMKTRSYGVNLRGSSGIQKINFCPWCSSKLPTDLTENFFSELSIVLNRHATLFDIDQAPSEFHSDEWLEKRGL